MDDIMKMCRMSQKRLKVFHDSNQFIQVYCIYVYNNVYMYIF